MKLKYLGTAAAEGVPAIFCECETCKTARKRGGKEIRTRSQAIVDNELLIDFPADTYMHFLNNNIVGGKIKSCIITHTHQDHLYAEDFEMRFPGFAPKKSQETLTVYGSERVGKAMAMQLFDGRKNSAVKFEEVRPYEPFFADGYKITALKAVHDVFSNPYFYMIEKDGKTLLYGNDTDYFDDSVWEYFEKTKPHFDLVSLDCTNGNMPKVDYIGHMGLNVNIKVKERLLKMGCADEKTIFVCNHFSHNADDVLYEEFSKIAEKQGFLTSYDGMEIEF